MDPDSDSTKTMRIRIHNTAFTERISYFLLTLSFSPSHLLTFSCPFLPSYLLSRVSSFKGTFLPYLLTISSYLLMYLLTFLPLTSYFTFCRVFWRGDPVVPEHVHRGENHPGQVYRHIAHAYHPHRLLCTFLPSYLLTFSPFLPSHLFYLLTFSCTFLPSYLLSRVNSYHIFLPSNVTSYLFTSYFLLHRLTGISEGRSGGT
jgi:hypothetical protein